MSAPETLYQTHARIALAACGPVLALRNALADCAAQRAKGAPQIYYFAVARELRRLVNCAGHTGGRVS